VNQYGKLHPPPGSLFPTCASRNHDSGLRLPTKRLNREDFYGFITGLFTDNYRPPKTIYTSLQFSFICLIFCCFSWSLVVYGGHPFYPVVRVQFPPPNFSPSRMFQVYLGIPPKNGSHVKYHLSIQL
jgi:hypothetical protein